MSLLSETEFAIHLRDNILPDYIAACDVLKGMDPYKDYRKAEDYLYNIHMGGGLCTYSWFTKGVSIVHNIEKHLNGGMYLYRTPVAETMPVKIECMEYRINWMKAFIKETLNDPDTNPNN